MRIVFAGTPEFAVPSLRVAARHGEVVAVYTQPDRPAGRGRGLAASPVKREALALRLPVLQPMTLREAPVQAQLRALQPDLMVVVAYGLILPRAVLAIPIHGCWNVHASLLPRWRGAAPIQRAIEAGDARTGITIMQMDAGLDTGPMRLVRTLPIGPRDTGGTVHDALAALGAEAIVEALARLADGTLPLEPQPPEGATHAAKLTRADSPIDWHAPVRRIVDRVRAFDPVPGSTAELEHVPGTTLKVWRAAPDARPAHGATPGTVLAVGEGAVVVAAGDGAVALLELQRPGGRRLPAREFLAGFPIRVGDRLRPPAAA